MTKRGEAEHNPVVDPAPARRPTLPLEGDADHLVGHRTKYPTARLESVRQRVAPTDSFRCVDAGARPLRIGHKGADAVVAGNTLASFRAAVEAGVDIIELDVLRPRSDFAAAADWRGAPAGPSPRGSSPLLVAHDWRAAAAGNPPTLDEVLDAFAEPPLDEVTIDLDLKVAGREDEVIAALRERDLVGRAMASTMEVPSLRELRRLAPELRLGWTIPRIRRDWTRSRWARPLVVGGLTALRARLPAAIRRHAAELGIWSVWAYHPVITARLIAAARDAGIAVIAWTVDDPDRIADLATLGVDGICTNDPRLLA
jgi:glycerophosphoryl diester phosphodiesterase